MNNIIVGIFFSFLIPFFVKKKDVYLVFAIGFPILMAFQILFMQISHEYDSLILNYAVPISFAVNKIYLNFAIFIIILWLFANVYSVFYIAKKYGEEKLAKFMPFYNLAVGMSILTAFAGNLFTTFIFYEMLTLATLPLIGFGGGNENKKSLVRYMLMLSFCAIVFFLPAIFLFQGAVGTTEFMQGDGTILTLFGQDFNQDNVNLNSYSYAPSPLMMVVIFIMILFGVAKSAIFPFNGWLPSAMCAPSPVSALLHAVAIVKIGVFIIYKVIYELYGMNYMVYLQFLYKPVFFIIILCIVLGIVVASIRALNSFDIKQILAFSTIVNMGYIILLFMSFSDLGVRAGFWCILIHGVSKIGLFFIAGVLYLIYHTNNYRRMAGAFNRYTILSFAFGLFVFSMIGMPLTAGFIAKQFIFEVFSENFIVICGVVFASSAGAIYMLRPLIYIFSSTKKHIVDHSISTVSYTIILPLAVVNILIFCVGFFWKSLF